MKLSNHRHLQLILILSKAEQPLSSEKLAARLSVTSRTIKSDLMYLKSFLKAHDIDLIAKKGQGFYFKINDYYKYRALLKQHDVDQQLNDYHRRLVYLTQRLLSSDRYVMLEDLAQELFSNKQQISHDLKVIRKLFRSYHLELINRPNHGMYLKGPELERMRCCIEHNRYQKIVPSFDQLFINRKRIIDHYGLPLINFLKRHQLFFTNAGFETFINELTYLSQHPLKPIPIIHLHQDHSLLIEWRSLFRTFDDFKKLDQSLFDYLFISLISHLDIDAHTSKLLQLNHPDVKRQIEQMSTLLKTTYKINFSAHADFTNQLMPLIAPTQLLHRNGLSTSNILDSYYFEQLIEDPIIMSLLEIISQAFKKIGMVLSIGVLENIGYLLIQCFQKISFPYQKRKIAAIYDHSFIHLTPILTSLKLRFKPYIKAIDCVSEFNFDQVNYDHYLNFKKEPPFKVIQPVDSIDLKQSINQMTALDDFIDHVIYPGFHFEKRIELQLFNMKISEKKEFHRLIQTCNRYKHLLVKCYFGKGKKEFIKLFHFSKSIRKGSKKYRYLLIINVNIENELDKLKYLQLLLNCLKNKSIKELNQLFELFDMEVQRRLEKEMVKTLLK